MSHIVSPYDRQGGFLESQLGMALIFLAGLFSIGIHILVGWALLYWLPGLMPHRVIEVPKPEVLFVDLGRDVPPPAPAAPDAPVDKNYKGPDVVDAPKSDPTIPQPPLFPPTPEALAAPPDVIPIGPKAPDKPPVVTKKAPPPKPTPPKVREDPPPKPKVTANSEAEQNKAMEKIERIVAAKNAADPNSDKVNVNIESGRGDGVGSQPSGAPGNIALHPEAERYYAHVRDIISKNWANPDEGMRQIKTVVRLTLAPDGAIKAIILDASSGNKTYDESVLRAIKLSSPLPPLPAVFGGQGITTPRFQFSPEDMGRSANR